MRAPSWIAILVLNKLQNLERKPYNIKFQFDQYGRIVIWKCWLMWRKGTRELRPKPLEQGRNQQQTQLTHMALGWNWSQAAFIGGRQALLPLSHPCSHVYCTPAHVINLVAFWILFVYNREKLIVCKLELGVNWLTWYHLVVCQKLQVWILIWLFSWWSAQGFHKSSIKSRRMSPFIHIVLSSLNSELSLCWKQ